MRIEYKIIAVAALLGLVSWMILSLLDCHELYMRASVFVSFLIFGIVASRILARRREMERGHLQAERKYRTLIENLPQKIFLKDQKSIYISCNRNYARDLKIKPHDIAGKTDYDFFPKELADKYRAEEQRILEMGNPREREERVVRNGEEAWIHVIKAPVKDENGNYIGILGISLDITEIKRKANLLKDREQRLKETESIGQIGNWEWNIETNEWLWSDEIYRIFGLNPREFGANLEGFLKSVHPEDRDMVKNSIDGALYRKKPYSIGHRIVLPDGSVREVHENAKVFFNDIGKPIRMLGTVQDLTERKKTEEELKKHQDHFEELVKEHTAGIEDLNIQLKKELAERKRTEEKLKQSLEELERSNKDLEQFAYAASHDMQEPLRMVASYTQPLEKRYKDNLDNDAKDFIKYASDGATRMQKLINGLLSYSRIQTRGKPFRPIDCASVVDQAIANLQIHIEETQAIIERDDLPTVDADEMQLIRLFQNLIDNALKFHGTEVPRIQISASHLGNKWMLSVSDNGIGIDSKYKDRIFIIFQRLHGEEEYPGTGMGLAICKRIVERHGGQIWIDSDPGKGSTFYFTIPA